MSDKMTAINPQILVWAREASGTSITEAEEHFGKEKLAKWEQGLDFPTYAQLKLLGEYYRKPIAVFFFPNPPVLKSIPASCRTLPENIYSKFDRGIVKLMDRARVMQLYLYELNADQNPAPFLLTKLGLDTVSVSVAASQLRQFLGADLDIQKSIKKKEDAFEYWRDCFYTLGIYVFKDAFKDNTLSGFCLYNDEFPIIYINNSCSLSRQIFTLFHEVYHLINKTSGVDLINDSELLHQNFSDKDIEISCNRFAGEFLVPTDDFLKITHKMKPTDENVSKLATLYCVSNEVILRKFLDNKKISVEFYEAKSEEFAQDYFRYKEKKKEKSGGGDYYNTQAIYKGRQYLQLVFSRYYSKQIDILQLARYMNMKIPNVKGLASRKGWGAL